MGKPLDKTRPTRFPKTPPVHVQSQQLNLRELEDAILWLQDENESLKAAIATLTTKVDNLG